ncbi:MAG: hypothetical protein ACREAF_06740 [Nitrosopumilaceae archaeon]
MKGDQIFLSCTEILVALNFTEWHRNIPAIRCILNHAKEVCKLE